MRTTAESLHASFELFLSQLEPQPSPQLQESHIEKFEHFLGQCFSTIEETLRVPLELAKIRLQPILRYLPQNHVDILAVAGLQADEDRYTNLIDWMLTSRSNLPALAKDLQKNWLESVGIKVTDLTFPAEVSTQIVTDDGIPDLIMRFPERLVIVEAKTISVEHPTPSGLMQTIAYPAAMRRYDRLEESFPIDVIFLTMDRSKPSNSNAYATTYIDFCLSALTVLNDDTSDELRASWSSIAFHFLNHATPESVDVIQTLQALEKTHWKVTPDLMARIDDVTTLLTLIGQKT